MLDFEELRAFHTERRAKNVTVTCEKSLVPMVWLDSSILIDFAKVANHEKIGESRTIKLSRLKETIYKAVREERLICPEWDQSLEFEGRRLEHQIRRIVSDLSCGAHSVTYVGVQDKEIARGLKAYLAFADDIHIPSSIFFHGSPAARVREAKQNGFIVDVDMPKPPEWIAKAERNRSDSKVDLE
jgi:hypothetical protein